VIRNSRIGFVQPYHVHELQHVSALSLIIWFSVCVCSTRDQGSLKSQLSQLLKAVSSHRSAWPFHEPVDTSVVVDYLDHIKEPVDLQLISKRIDSGAYLSKATFKADLEKMCDNCTTYNTPDTNYYKAAMDLREFIQSRVQVRDHK
jgi:histone acetyltransferase